MRVGKHFINVSFKTLYDFTFYTTCTICIVPLLHVDRMVRLMDNLDHTQLKVNNMDMDYTYLKVDNMDMDHM